MCARSYRTNQENHRTIMTDFRTVPRQRNRLGKEQQNEIEFRISQADVQMCRGTKSISKHLGGSGNMRAVHCGSVSAVSTEMVNESSEHRRPYANTIELREKCHQTYLPETWVGTQLLDKSSQYLGPTRTRTEVRTVWPPTRLTN